MTLLFVDCETYSEADLPAVGAHEYAAHPSTEAMLWAVQAEDWPRALVFERDDLYALLHELKAAGQIEWTRNRALRLVHWGEFDRLIALRGREPAHESSRLPAMEGPENTLWCDLREVSLTYGGPGKLSHAAAFWGRTELKDEGKHLISRFCRPQKRTGKRIRSTDDPVRWERFRSYAGQDATALVPIFRTMNALEGGHSHAAHWYWLRLVGRMNERGVPIDREACRAAWGWFERLEAELVSECQERFGFSPSQTEEVRKFLGTPDVRRETLEAVLKTWPDQGEGKAWEESRRVAEIRLTLAGAARKKIAPMLAMSTSSGRVRGCFDYHGAWTRRLTSFGVQWQNFVREKVDERFFDTIHDDQDERFFAEARRNIRGFIRAPEGKTFVAADYSKIELCVSAWVADETWLLEALHRGDDVYRMTAGSIYGVPVEDVSDAQRQFGKIVELGSGYGLGGRGLSNQCAAQGIEIGEDRAAGVIQTYRRTHPAIVRTWGEFQRCFEALIPAAPGTRLMAQGIAFERWATHIRVVRPSGFAQYYWNPRLAQGQWPDGGSKTEILYTGRRRDGSMGTKSTYGGDIFQGVVQGVAADLMLHGMGVAERAGYAPVLSIHDEVVCEVLDTGKSHVDRLCWLLCQRPAWAKGIPVRAEGWQGRRFTK